MLLELTQVLVLWKIIWQRLKKVKIQNKITLSNPDGVSSDYPISHSFPNIQWEKVNTEFDQDVDIVLMDMDHHYFYENYNSKVKIFWNSLIVC